MSVSLANPWWHVGAFMLLPAYALFIMSRRRLKKYGSEGHGQTGASAMFRSIWQLRWYAIVGLISFGISVVLVAGIHPLVIGVEATDTTLTLENPWPHSNVRLGWAEVSEAHVESRQFGVRGKTKFRLSVKARSSDYFSLWIGTADEVQRAQAIIRSHLTKPVPQSPA